jgi:hypothetical protein
MASSFWKALGSKLVETGAAYLQQVRVVDELKRLSPQEARERFAQYVQGLSSTARAGLAVTLATLANGERSADARRLIDSLRATLLGQKPDAGTDAASIEAVPARGPADAFDDDLQRLDDWFRLDGDGRAEAVAEHLAALDPDGLRALQGHLERMQANCAERLREHHDDEARIVAGRFFEDQIAYRDAVLRTGQHDPGWLQHLRELEGYREWFDQVHGMVVAAIDARSRPAPPPPSESGDDLRAVAGMRQLLEEQLRSGAVRGERAAALRRTLDQIEQVFAARARDEIEKSDAIQRILQIYADSASMLADPGAAARVAGGSPRLREVDRLAGAIKVALGRELMEAPPAATASALAAVLGDLTRFQQLVAEVADDDALAQLEADLLRPAARARHELAMTRHALIARPLWESIDYLPQANDVAYAGGADLQPQLEAAVGPRRLTLVGTRQLQNHGQLRWDTLNRCHVAVFDLRGAGDIAALASSRPKRAREIAGAAYELGLAFALGKPVVVVAAAGETMPFDIDLAALALDGDDEDVPLLQQAIDEALYVPQRTGRSSSLRESLAFVDRLTAGHAQRKVFEGMKWLEPALASDPAGFAAALELLFRKLEPPPWRLLRPAWPGAYPDAGPPRCFHVMPFGPDWADEARDAARAACQERGFGYRRGDEAEDGRIIPAIWDDLCRAGVVLVDLSGANLNVLIELGIAHAIGRPVLAVQRRGSVDIRPRHVEKLRVLPYGSAAELKRLLLDRLPH